MKKCITCLMEKPLSDFHKQRKSKDGLRNKCKRCVNIFGKKYYKENSTRILLNQKKRWNKFPDKCKAIQSASNHKHADKRAQKAREEYKINPEKKIEQNREYRANNKEKINKYTEKYRQNNPIKVNAQNIVKAALKNGQLIRRPCEECGNKKVDAHHKNYTKPLDISWLCRLHHMEWHRINGEGCLEA